MDFQTFTKFFSKKSFFPCHKRKSCSSYSCKHLQSALFEKQQQEQKNTLLRFGFSLLTRPKYIIDKDIRIIFTTDKYKKIKKYKEIKELKTIAEAYDIIFRTYNKA